MVLIDWKQDRRITLEIENQKSPGESVFFLKDRGVMFVGDALIGKVPGKLNMLPPDKYKDLELAKKGLNKLLDFEYYISHLLEQPNV